MPSQIAVADGARRTVPQQAGRDRWRHSVRLLEDRCDPARVSILRAAWELAKDEIRGEQRGEIELVDSG